MNTKRVLPERIPQPSWVHFTALFCSVMAACASCAVAWVGFWWARAEWNTDFATPLTRVTAVLAAIGALAALRLALSCLAALPYLWPAAGRMASSELRTLAPSSSSTHAGRRIRFGSKTAAVLLTVIASLGSASAASAATGPAITVSASAEAETSVAPLPTFSAPAVIDSHDAAATDRHAVTAETPAVTCDAPKPGWTPSAAVFDESACLITGVPRPGPEREHTVVRGETLWSIASAELPETASPSEIATRVQAWLTANPAIQAHPDLLRAGDQLVSPSTAPSHH